MSFQIAPYNEAMRLGMGFNSYTQTLCVNDVVQKVDGKASEDDLHPATSTKTTKASNDDKPLLGGDSGSTVVRGTDGQNEISQVVSWEAKFVNKFSDVTDTLDISGSLAIKVDAIGASGKAEGHYFDSNIFKDSDINYLIQVKVTNQKLVANDVTQFVPIRNVQPSQFTEVYGDSYISGFLEGGIFNALISVKLKDKSATQKIGGSLAVKLGFEGVSVEGQAKGEKVTINNNNDAETTISVSWSGGGDIKPDKVSEWTLDTLKSVAMEFPDKVARCPQRVSAIITKYAGLRSFYEQNLKGSPLDYENAGVYSSSLLDAYVDYKNLWKQLQTGTYEVENGLSRLEQASSSTDLDEYRNESTKAWESRSKGTQPPEGLAGSKGAESLTKTGFASAPAPNQVMMEPNAMKLYSATLFGLDRARRDCRFEMIKIVREVDAVTYDPAVAIDPTRIWQYLSPTIFRQLLPRTISVLQEKLMLSVKELTAKEAELKKSLTDLDKRITTDTLQLTDVQKQLDDAKATKEPSETELVSLHNQLEALKADVARSEATEKALRADVQTARDDTNRSALGPRFQSFAQSGFINSVTAGLGRGSSDTSVKNQFTFEKSLSTIPRVMFGLRHMAFRNDSGLVGFCFDIKEDALDRNGFVSEPRAFGGCKVEELEMSWLALPETDYHMETGVFDSWSIDFKEAGTLSERIWFQKRFHGTPKVICWFYEVAQSIPTDAGRCCSLEASVADVGERGFTLNVKNWDGRTFKGACIGWFAYDSNEDGRRVKVRSITAGGGVSVVSQGISVNAAADKYRKLDLEWGGYKDFKGQPAVFSAISKYDLWGSNVNVHAVAGKVASFDRKRVQVEAGALDGTQMTSMSMVVIGVDSQN